MLSQSAGVLSHTWEALPSSHMRLKRLSNRASETESTVGERDFYQRSILDYVLEDARRVMALMPGPQGVMPWPGGKPNISLLCEDTLWPVQAGQVDKLVLMHGLETSENPTALLDEIEDFAVNLMPLMQFIWRAVDPLREETGNA